jgi:hypothetical protein
VTGLSPHLIGLIVPGHLHTVASSHERSQCSGFARTSTRDRHSGWNLRSRISPGDCPEFAIDNICRCRCEISVVGTRRRWTGLGTTGTRSRGRSGRRPSPGPRGQARRQPPWSSTVLDQGLPARGLSSGQPASRRQIVRRLRPGYSCSEPVSPTPDHLLLSAGLPDEELDHLLESAAQQYPTVLSNWEAKIPENWGSQVEIRVCWKPDIEEWQECSTPFPEDIYPGSPEAWRLGMPDGSSPQGQP